MDEERLSETISNMAKDLEAAVAANGDLAAVISNPEKMAELLSRQQVESGGDDGNGSGSDSDKQTGKDGSGEEGEEVEEGEENEQTILEEYKLWRKNCRYMYSFVSETALTWPSLSIQFVRANTFENKMKDTKFGVTRNLLLTTHTSGEDDDYVKLASLQLPRSLTEKKVLTSEELETVNSRLKISKKYKQDVEVNKIRTNPFDSKVWSTINANGEVFVYNIDSKMNEVWKKKLEHHTMNGFGLSWDPNNQYQLVTGSEDKTIAVWDYQSADADADAKSVKPKIVYDDVHDDFVNDVRFSYKRNGVIGSVGEDKLFVLADSRSKSVSMKQVINKSTSFNSLTFSSFSENLVLFGGEDSNNYIYDLRRMDRCLHTLMGHKKSITNVEWDPFHENIVASSSMDRRVILWDLAKIGEEQLPEEAEDGVPELLMMHGGHTGGVNDFAFSPEIEWCLASCSDDNIVHVWGVKDEIVRGSDPDADADVEIDPSVLE